MYVKTALMKKKDISKIILTIEIMLFGRGFYLKCLPRAHSILNDQRYILLSCCTLKLSWIKSISMETPEQ